MLQKAVAANVDDWTFPMEAAGREVRVTIEFQLNCSTVPAVPHHQ
jgi:hypothetical protein